MRRRRGSQTAVELVEEDAHAGAAGDAARDEDAPRRAWRPSARAWWSAAGVAVLAVAVAAVAQARAEDRYEQLLERVAPGGPSLDEPLVRAWQAAFRGTVGMYEDLLVAEDPEGPGLVAIDTRDGTVRWRQDHVTEAWGCQVTSGDAPTPTPATTGAGTPAVPEPALVVCHGVGGSGPSAVHVLDAATGRHEHTLEVGGASSSTVLAGPDLAAIGVADDGHVTAGRWSLRTGEQRWSYRSPDPVPGGAGSAQSSGMGDDALDITVGGRQVVLDATTGEPLPTAPDTDHEVVRPLEDGSVVTVRLDDDGMRTEVRTADGRLLWERDGSTLHPGADDGTAPGLVLMTPGTGRGLLGVDARTGAVRWEHTVAGAGGTGEVLVLASLVVVTVGTGSTTHPDAGLVALDAGSGAVVWEHTDGDVAAWDVFTDGRRVLTLGQVDGTPHLVARDVRSGTVAWSVPVPAGAYGVWPLPDRGVLVVGDEQATAFRPPGG